MNIARDDMESYVDIVPGGILIQTMKKLSKGKGSQESIPLQNQIRFNTILQSNEKTTTKKTSIDRKG